MNAKFKFPTHFLISRIFCRLVAHKKSQWKSIHRQSVTEYQWRAPPMCCNAAGFSPKQIKNNLNFKKREEEDDDNSNFDDFPSIVSLNAMEMFESIFKLWF